MILGEEEDDEMEGLIKANGKINWDCPCLQGMAYGPCGEQFKAAFSCFHYSEADPKGSDCIPQFRDMQECFVKYPEIYGKDDDLALDGDEESKDDLLENSMATNNGTETKELFEPRDSLQSDLEGAAAEPIQITENSSNAEKPTLS